MEFTIKNLGPIKTAKIELKPLTIFVGENNTGKTYLADSLYNFFNRNTLNCFPAKREYKLIFDIRSALKKTDIENLLAKGEAQVDIPLISIIRENQNYFNELLQSKSFQNMLKESVDENAKYFPDFIGGQKDDFKNLNISLAFNENETRVSNESLKKLQRISLLTDTLSFEVEDHSFTILLIKEPNKKNAILRIFLFGDVDIETLLNSNKLTSSFNRELTRAIFYFLIFCHAPEKAYIFPTHRNTLALDIVNKSMSSFLTSLTTKDIENKHMGMSNFEKGFNISNPMNDFLQKLNNFNFKAIRGWKYKKFYYDVVQDFEKNVLRGKIKIEKIKGANEGRIKFVLPDINKEIDLITTSSMIQQLSSFILYLKYDAAPNDIILIDEPESNLHPKAQLKIVELVSYLVNNGIWVIITTHTPYIIDHINNLIYGHEVYNDLKNKKDHKEKLKDFPLKPEVLLNPGDISAYYFAKEGDPKSIIENNRINWGTFGKITDELDTTFSSLMKLDNTLKNGKKGKT